MKRRSLTSILADKKHSIITETGMKNFNKKEVSCKYSDLLTTIRSLEDEWIKSLLVKNGIPPMMVKKAMTDKDYPQRDWREYLVQNGITITHDMGAECTRVFKLDTERGLKVMLGEWKPPEITFEGDVSRCQLKLDYWQI